MKLSVLSSGSKGNSSIITKGNSSILLDSGLSGTSILNRIDEIRADANDFKITPIPVSHDGTKNHAYNIEADGKKITHLTDLGMITNLVVNRIDESDLIVLESNHDVKMLMNGPYPWELKQRVKGRCGHLSNEDACNLISKMKTSNLKNVILAHLSEENNDEVLAHDFMVKKKEELCLDFKITIAKQNRPLEYIKI